VPVGFHSWRDRSGARSLFGVDLIAPIRPRAGIWRHGRRFAIASPSSRGQSMESRSWAWSSAAWHCRNGTESTSSIA
jgi:hypothetical protein